MSRILLLLIGLSVLVYGKSIRYDYIATDDGLLVVADPLLQPVSAAHLRQIWTEPYCGSYLPVTLTVWSGVSLLAHTSTPDGYGNFMNPYWFHLLNVVLHTTTVILVWRILVRLGFGRWPAAAGAALFCLHPLQVESVAWISSGKDLLAGCLAMAAILMFLRFVARRSWVNYVAATVSFLLAILSKPTASVTPLVLLILLTFVPRADRKRAALWLAPLFVLMVPLGLVTKYSQSAATAFFWSPLWARPFEAVDALAFYLCKLVWPINLAIDYSRTPAWVFAHRSDWVWWILPVAVAAAVYWLRRRSPSTAAGAGIFAVALLPVLGIVPFLYQTYSTVADRYVYVAMLGVAIFVAGIADRVQLRRGGAVLIGVLTVFGLLAFVQTGAWASSDSLYEHAVEACPSSGFGWLGVATTRSEHDDWTGAVDALHHALSIRPDDYQTLSALSQAYLHLRDRKGYELTQAWMNYESIRLTAMTRPDSATAQQRWKNIETQPPTTRP